MTYTLNIFDTETDEVSERIEFESDEAAEAYWNSMSEAYPENFDFYIVWAR